MAGFLGRRSIRLACDSIGEERSASVRDSGIETLRVVNHLGITAGVLRHAPVSAALRWFPATE